MAAITTLASGAISCSSALNIQEPEETRPPENYSACFPLKLLACCPSPVRALVPSTFSVIQDWTHLSLIFGVLASVAIIAETCVHISKLKFDDAIATAKEFIFIIFVAPVACYFIKVIGQYDGRLRKKQAECKEQKAALTREYNGVLSDMDGMMSKVAESSAHLAERSFESKRRDFQRFLERAKSRYAELADAGKVKADELLVNFKCFVMNWLKVFAECSIDPILAPKSILKPEEMDRCLTIEAVCDLVLPRLRCTEVRFITVQKEQDTQMVKKQRGEYRRLTAHADTHAIQSLESGSNYGGGFGRSNRDLIQDLAPTQPGKRLSWIKCGNVGCGCDSSEGYDGYPRSCRCVCLQLVRLSGEHTRLMVGFIAGFLIFGLEFLHAHIDKDVSHRLTLLIEVGFVQICIAILLVRFEEIDEVQKLEREIKDLKRAEANVRETQQKMHEFWTNVTQLTELWLYRTVPRLDLYKEVHEVLADAEPKDLNQWMRLANEKLQGLDSKLGELKQWRQEGALPLEDKKQFGKQINTLCQEQNFSKIADKLDKVIAPTAAPVRF